MEQKRFKKAKIYTLFIFYFKLIKRNGIKFPILK